MIKPPIKINTTTKDEGPITSFIRAQPNHT